MSETKKSTRSKSMSSQRSGSDSPAKPEPEETGPICSGGSQNVPIPTWGTFDTSNCTDEGAQAEVSAKKEKDKKSKYQKLRKGLKKVRSGKKSSDQAGKKEQKITEEYEKEELSEATPTEHEEVQSHGDHSYLPGEEEDHLSTPPTKESLWDLADELEQCRQEKETLQQRNKVLEERLANSVQELDRSRLQLEKSVKAMEDLWQKKMESENKEKEMLSVHEFEIQEFETCNQVLENKLVEGNVRLEKMEQELTETRIKLDKVGGEVQLREAELDDTRMQNDQLNCRNIELCHNIETMETSLRDKEKKMQEKENKLKKVEEDLKEQKEEILSSYKEKYTAVNKYEDALRLSREEIKELESKVKKLTRERESFTTLEETLENTKNPNVQMSLVASEANLHQKQDDITLEKILQEKNMEIRDLKEQLQALGRKISRAKQDQMENQSEEETKEPSDLQEVTTTLTFELKSIKSQLIRAESEHSDISMEKSALKKEMKKLEEENLKLQTEAAQLKEKLEFWQQKCENEGIDSKTAGQTGVLIVNLLQIELMELKRNLLRRENEVQTMAECRKKLEERLLITRQERDRQHDQIMSLLVLKANLTEELDRYGSYGHNLGEFKEKSLQFKKAHGIRIAEVAGLREEKAALVKEMESMKEEIETRKLEVSYIRKDFVEERKDRERMVSEIDIVKVKWEVARQELVDAVEEDLKKEKFQTEYMETQFKEARVTWNTKRSEYEIEIVALTDQVELLQTKVEELTLWIDQGKKEYDAKLTVTEGRLLNERQKLEQALKELSHVTELLQCSQQDFNSRLAEANAIHEKLQLNLEIMSVDKSSIEDEFKLLQEEMHTQKCRYESEKNTAEKKIDKLYEYSDQLQQTVGILDSEKDVLIEDTRKMKLSFQEGNRKLISIQQDLEMKLEESKQLYGKEKQLLTNKLKSLEMLRRTMKSHLDEEKQRADENRDNLSKLSRDLVTKDQVIDQYQKELLFFQDRLESIEQLNVQYGSENQGLNLQNVELKQQLEQHTRDCLENYEIKVVQCIKDKVGSGSYGSISMVSVNGMPCIQKRLHDILVGLSGTEAVGQDQQKYISDKFYDECMLLWKMRHPNIVQFMGIHYYGRVDEKNKMSLIMEYLPTNVEECITTCKKAQLSIPLSIKFSILRDVAYGLSHLHANDIIHRDLSAANVLLTDSLRAKIADLGVSKLVPPDAYNKFTVAPGAQYIMPPEALEENPRYSTKLDIFSYGILSLYLILQKIPHQTKSTLKPDHVKTRQTEIGCRMSHIQQLERINSGLQQIVIQSLLDDPESRPNAAKLSGDITECICRAKFDFYSDLTTFIKLMGKKVFPDI